MQSSWVENNPFSLLHQTPLTTQHLTRCFASSLKWGSHFLPACNPPTPLCSPVLQRPRVDQHRPLGIQRKANLDKAGQLSRGCPITLSSSKRHLKSKWVGQNTSQRYRLSHHICITLNRELSSQTKQPSQALLLQTKHTLNRDYFKAFFVFNTCHKQRVVCLAGFCLGGGFDGVTLFWLI